MGLLLKWRFATRCLKIKRTGIAGSFFLDVVSLPRLDAATEFWTLFVELVDSRVLLLQGLVQLVDHIAFYILKSPELALMNFPYLRYLR